MVFSGSEKLKSAVSEEFCYLEPGGMRLGWEGIVLSAHNYVPG